MERARLVAALLAAGAVGALTSSCASSAAPVDSGGPQPTLQSLQDRVFTPRCAEAGCHGIDLPKQGVALFNPTVTMETMINKPPTVGDAARTYPAIIVPGDPDRSFLLNKISGPVPEGHGLVMPPLRAPLTPETIAAIRTWIASMPR